MNVIDERPWSSVFPQCTLHGVHCFPSFKCQRGIELTWCFFKVDAESLAKLVTG